MISIPLDWNNKFLPKFPGFEDDKFVKNCIHTLKNEFLDHCIIAIEKCLRVSANEFVLQHQTSHENDSNLSYEEYLKMAISGYYYNGKCLMSHLEADWVSVAINDSSQRKIIDLCGELLKDSNLGNRVINVGISSFIRNHKNLIQRPEGEILRNMFLSEKLNSVSIRCGDFTSVEKYFEYENPVCNYHDFEHLIVCSINPIYAADLSSFRTVCDFFPYIRRMVPSDGVEEMPVISGKTIYRTIIPNLLSLEKVQAMRFSEIFDFISDYICNWLLGYEQKSSNINITKFPENPISTLEWCILAYGSGYEAPAAMISTYTNYQKRLTPFIEADQSFMQDLNKSTSDILQEIISRKFLTADEVYGISDVAYREAIVKVGEVMSLDYPVNGNIPFDVFSQVLSNLKYQNQNGGILKPLADWLQSGC